MKAFSIFSFFTLLAFFGCTKSELTVPPVSDDANLKGTIPIPFSTASSIKKMEGIYKLTAGTEVLGNQFVCKVSKYKVSFFSNSNGIFFILKYGYKVSDGSIQFSGFYRYSEKTTQGNIHFSISAAEGATDLLAGVVSNLKLQGVVSGDQLTLQYNRAFSAYAINNELMIFAHHGVQTTADPPFAENSILGVLNDGDYGVNGLEMDVRLTKDNIPILIHDPTINTRLTRKGPLFGYWDQYPFPFLTQYVRLIDGQSVPSVEQALKTFVDSTSLKYFWMDIKGNEGIFKYLEPIVRNAYANAAAQNRNVIIFAGLPSEDVITDFNTQPTYKSGNPAHSYSSGLPTLAEQTIDIAIENGSSFFGPRYTEGLLLADVDKAHSHGIKVISWTLNSKALITNYLENGKFDGFITDYPCYVVYDFYTKF